MSFDWLQYIPIWYLQFRDYYLDDVIMNTI